MVNSKIRSRCHCWSQIDLRSNGWESDSSWLCCPRTVRRETTVEGWERRLLKPFIQRKLLPFIQLCLNSIWFCLRCLVQHLSTVTIVPLCFKYLENREWDASIRFLSWMIMTTCSCWLTSRPMSIILPVTLIKPLDSDIALFKLVSRQIWLLVLSNRQISSKNVFITKGPMESVTLCASLI